MEDKTKPQSFVRALNTDNRRELENLCLLFKEQGVTLGYPAALLNPRAWLAINNKASAKLVSVTVGTFAQTAGHISLKTDRLLGSAGEHDFDVALSLGLGATEQIVTQLKVNRTIQNAHSITYLGPRQVFESGKFARELGLSSTALLASLEWMYAVSAVKEPAKKAMAIFVPEVIAKNCEQTFAELGLLRKRKNRKDSTDWALPADLSAVTSVDRKAGLYAINPSLLGNRQLDLSFAVCLLVNIFDPHAAEFITKTLEQGYEFSGLAPRLNGIDYAVLSRSAYLHANSANTNFRTEQYSPKINFPS